MSLWRKRQVQTRIDAVIDPLNVPAKKGGPVHPDYAIRGEMVMVTRTISEFDSLQKNNPNDIINLKFELAQELGVELLKHGCVEFTSLKEPMNFTAQVRARVFVVPSEDVQILREKGF